MYANEIRMAKVFGADEVQEVSEENLLRYRQYILQNLDRKAILTGREDFPWEEKYVVGPGCRTEYEELKRTNPSYTDEYELIDILKDVIKENDLIAEVKRLSDGKHFEIGLSWLAVKKKRSKAHQLLDDFSNWAVNW